MEFDKLGVTEQTAWYENLYDAAERRFAANAACSLPKLAEAIHHPAGWAADCTIKIRQTKRITHALLEEIKLGFQVISGNSVCAGLDISINCLQDVELVSRVVGCSHLSLRSSEFDHGVCAALCAGLALHTRLTSLLLHVPVGMLGLLLQCAQDHCPLLSRLELTTAPERTSGNHVFVYPRFFSSSLQRLTCLTLNLDVVLLRHCVADAIAFLPELVWLQLVGRPLDSEAVSTAFKALQTRCQPIRALLLHGRGASDGVLSSLGGSVERCVLNQLCWFEYYHQSTHDSEYERFVTDVLPGMTRLRQLCLGRLFPPALQRRLISAIPRPTLLRRLHVFLSGDDDGLMLSPDVWQNGKPLLTNCSMPVDMTPALMRQLSSWPTLHELDLSYSSDDSASPVIADVLEHLEHLRHLLLPRTMAPGQVCRALRSSLAAMQHLMHLGFPVPPEMHDELACALLQVLPGLRSIRNLDIMSASMPWVPVLDRVFSAFPPFSLLSIGLTFRQAFVVPHSVMRAALHVHGSHSIHARVAPAHSTALAQHRSRLASLYTLATRVVLSDLPRTADFGRMPGRLTRAVLLAEFTCCHDCGRYCRLAEASVIVREIRLVPSRFMAHVVSCEACHTNASLPATQ